MAKKEHLDILKKGVGTWNRWRKKNPKIRPDLSEADLSRANLGGANLRWTNLKEVKNLRQEQLDEAMTYERTKLPDYLRNEVPS